MNLPFLKCDLTKIGSLFWQKKIRRFNYYFNPVLINVQMHNDIKNTALIQCLYGTQDFKNFLGFFTWLDATSYCDLVDKCDHLNALVNMALK